MNGNKFLKDNVANIILTCEECYDFVCLLVSKILKVDFKLIKGNLRLGTPRINQNVNTKNSFADAVYYGDLIVINFEVNTANNQESQNKNLRYVCNLTLKEVKVGEKDDLRAIYQININSYDIFNKNKFIYYSSIMENKYHIMRNENINIIDINLDFLKNINYTILEREEKNSLEKILYFFICKDIDIVDKLYKGDKIMEQVSNKLRDLTSVFDSLYYDYDEYQERLWNAEAYKLGVINIAKEMLKKDCDLDFIKDVTKLSIRKIKKLKNEIEGVKVA